MNGLHATLHALTEHLRSTLPAEPTTEQRALLENANAHLALLPLTCAAATCAVPLIDDLQDLLETPEELCRLFSGEERGAALFMAGLGKLVDCASDMASALSAPSLVTARAPMS